MTNRGEETSELRVWLVSHGQEHIALGGPTTRLLQIERTARAAGHSITATSDASCLLKNTANVGVAHVFNSWALQSAVNALSLAKRARAPVVFSPIMLNLSNRAFYDQGVQSVLQHATTPKQVEDGIALIHELTPAWERTSGKPPQQGISNHFEFIRRQTALADRIICLSAYERDLLTSIGVSDENMSIVQNGVDSSTMANANAAAFSEKYGLQDFVLMVGRIESRKNQALVAFALRDIDIPIVCIGHIGDQTYFQQLKRWAGTRFIHIDRIDDRDLLASAYKAARVLVLASWSEGAPLVALEAGSAGTPMILSNLSSERDYFGDYAEYVHPADLDGLRCAVQKHIVSPETATQRLVRSTFARDAFNIQRHVDSTLEQYAIAKQSFDGTGNTPSSSHVHLDATHLSHQFHNKKPLTGVPVVENELGKSILRLQKQATVSVWSSRSRQFQIIPTADFGSSDMGRAADTDKIITTSTDSLCEVVRLVVLSPRATLFGLLPSKGPGPRRRILTALKYVIRAVPDRFGVASLKAIQRIRPSFTTAVAPEHQLFERARRRSSNASVSETRSNWARFQIQTRSQPIARQETIESNSKLVVLGHAWISNDRYLADLAEFAARYRAKLWVHIPDILYATHAGTFDSKTTETYSRRLRQIIEIADTIITISEQSKSEISAFAEAEGIKRDVRQIALGIPENRVSESTLSLPIELARPFVLYVGSMSARKRHDFLIEAWRRARVNSQHTRAATLVLVGRPLPGFERFQEKKFQDQLAREGIVVLNDCDDAQIGTLYREAAFTVYPSEAEGWGIPPVESLTLGTPCLVSDTLPVALELKALGLKAVETGAIEAWVKAIQLWLDHPEHLQQATDSLTDFEPPSWDTAANILLAD